jgi:hypothetical protein
MKNIFILQICTINKRYKYMQRKHILQILGYSKDSFPFKFPFEIYFLNYIGARYINIYLYYKYVLLVYTINMYHVNIHYIY